MMDRTAREPTPGSVSDRYYLIGIWSLDTEIFHSITNSKQLRLQNMGWLMDPLVSPIELMRSSERSSQQELQNSFSAHSSIELPLLANTESPVNSILERSIWDLNESLAVQHDRNTDSYMEDALPRYQDPAVEEMMLQDANDTMYHPGSR